MKSYVRSVVRTEQKKVEKAAAIIRLGVFSIMLASFLVLEKDFPWTILPITLLSAYALVGFIGLSLAFAGIYRSWFAFVYSTLDILILFGFFLVLAEHYHMPLREIFRVPGATLIFLFIALAAFHYQVSLIVYTSALFVVLWLITMFTFGSSGETVSYAANAELPLKTEYMRLAITVFVALITALMVYRTRQLLLNSIIEARGKANLAKYLPAALVREMADSGVDLIEESHCQKAAVLFVDICGFTKLSENRPPKEVTGFLTEFRRRMNRAIIANGGTIDKFIGDAIMVVFGVPAPGKEDARNALLCGVDMLKILDVWNAERSTRGEEPVEVGIGIHYGDVIAGALGDESRVEYTVIGDTVNVAERIEGLTRNHKSSMFISAALHDNALPLPETLEFDVVPGTKLRGRSTAIDLLALSRINTRQAD